MVISALTLSSLNSYIEKTWFTMLSFIAYIVLCVIWGDFLLFLPLIFYDVIINKLRMVYLFVLIPLLSNYGVLAAGTLVVVAAFTTLAIMLRLRTLSYYRQKEGYIRLWDKSTEISTLLENKNVALLANQDHEINVATLSERNRIAREIHDNLGHILSRCLLQIGAMIAVNKDSGTIKNLNAIKDTLSKGMDSVRESVHNLHDESINLHEQLQALMREFTFCPVRFSCEIGDNPDRKLKYAFISIVKESLSNIMNHSNATMASVNLTEHPGFYQLVIHDNGKVKNYNPEKGIGIRNICDRVEAFGGYVNINTDNGFKIFVSIPKENL